jgi:hypothetical protein
MMMGSETSFKNISVHRPSPWSHDLDVQLNREGMAYVNGRVQRELLHMTRGDATADDEPIFRRLDTEPTDTALRSLTNLPLDIARTLHGRRRGLGHRFRH